MLPILQMGPLALQVPGMVLLIGVWLGLWLAEREALRLAAMPYAAGGTPAGVPPSPDQIYNLAFTGLLAGIVGARLAYAARFMGAYLADPLGLLSLSPATLAPLEGLLIGTLAALWYGSRRGLRLAPTLDALAPLAAVMGIALAGANWASGDGFGAPTRVAWRIFLWDDYRHPTQVYELMAAVAVLAAWRVWTLRAGTGLLQRQGSAFLLVVGLWAGARVFLEAFRGDSYLLPGGLRAAQVLGILILGICLSVWGRQARAVHQAGESLSANEAGP
jgi:phosphatidylglycerol---prolipoprotein diacylglyceryl transferase